MSTFRRLGRTTVPSRPDGMDLTESLVLSVRRQPGDPEGEALAGGPRFAQVPATGRPAAFSAPHVLTLVLLFTVA